MGIILIFLFGVALIAGPIVASILGHPLSGGMEIFLIVTGALVSLLAGILGVITRLYQKTQADEALVRTGWGGLTICQDGGIIFIPVVHKLIRVTFKTFKLEVKRDGVQALITRDKLRADIGAEFFVRVDPNDESIKVAARTLGERMNNTENVRVLVEDKLVSALRSVAAKRTLEELNSDREGFMEDVITSVSEDLKKNGLTLETATISQLDQTSVANLDENNVFDAEGLATIARITELKKTEANLSRRQGEQERKKQDVVARKVVLAEDQDEKTAEANQAAAVAKIQADKRREAEEEQIKAQRQVDLAAVQKEEAVQVATQKQQQQVEVAERQRLQAVAVAEEKKREAQTRAQQDVEVAERVKLQAVADAERQVAESETAKANAEAEREEARQKIETVKVVEEANRSKQREVISAEAEAQQAYVREEKAADAKAYAVTKDAEARKEAADADAEAVRKKAEADRDAQVASAAGQRAIEMVPVEVKERQVAVDQANVENVIKPELEAREQHGQVAQEFELEKARIQADMQVRIETARAAATIYQKVDIKAFATMDDVSNMTGKMMSGIGLSEMANGLRDGLESDTVTSIVNGITAIKGAVGALGRRAGLSEQELASGSTPVVVDKTADADASRTREGEGNSSNAE